MKERKKYSERELLSLIGQDDHEAFRTLFMLYRSQIYTAARRITGNEIMAEDIYQDVFLLVWLKRNSLIQIENFPGWLFTVARNKIYDAIKKMAANKTDRLDFITDIRDRKSISQEDHAQIKHLEKILHEALSRLPQKQRQAYILVRNENLSREEAAKRLQVSTETVKSNLDHAMRSIRAYCLRHLDTQLFLTLVIFLV